MNKLILSIVVFVMGFGLESNSQTFTKLDIKGYHATFADNNNILVTTNNYKGLELYNLVDEVRVVLSTEFKSGKDVYTKDDQIHFSLKQGVVKSDFGGNINSLVETENGFTAKEIALYEVRTISNSSEVTALFVKSINRLTALEVYFSNGSTKIISPLEKGARYLNSEVSSDGKSILIKQYGGSAYVVNLDGEIQKDLGYMERPKWSGTNKVVFQLSKDDGDVITGSGIFEIDTDSKELRELTVGFNGIALEPSVSPSGDKVIFNTPNGELFIINK